MLKNHRSRQNQPMSLSGKWRFLKDLYLCISPEIAVCSAVQAGKTEWMILTEFAMVEEGLQVFHIINRARERNLFVQNRINPPLNEHHSHLLEQAKKHGGSANSLSLKHLGRGSIKYVASTVKADFKEFPADAILVDEYDECDQKNIKYGKDRLEASEYGFEIYIGNPTYYQGEDDPYPLIADRYEMSTKNKWCTICSNCERPCPISWETMANEIRDEETGRIQGWELRDPSWHIDMDRDPQLYCIYCGEPTIDRLAEDAHWNEFQPSDDRPTGYHVSKMFVPTGTSKTLKKMWQAYLDAKGNPEALERFYNSILGRSFEGGGVKITEQDLKNLERQYSIPQQHHIPDVKRVAMPSGVCSAGIDVSGDRFHVIITDRPTLETRRLLFAGHVDSKESLYRLFRKYNVKAIVIDAEPEVRTSKEIVAQAPVTTAYRCKFRRTQGKVTTKQSLGQWNHRERLVTVDRTELLDNTTQQVLSGDLILPVNSETLVDGDFYKQFLALQRASETDTKGRLRYVWKGSSNDHFRLADGYDYLAKEAGSYIVGGFDLEML